MAKIAFDAKYRPQIESGEYRLETEGGFPATILDWSFRKDSGSPYICVKITRDGKDNAFLYSEDGKNIHCERVKDNNLIIITPDIAESEDERIRKALCDIVLDSSYMEAELRAHGLTVKETLTYLEKQEEQKPTAEEILVKAGLKPYKDGNQWCILVGDNIQEGICGFGDTIDEALYQLLKDVLEKQKEQKPAEYEKPLLSKFEQAVYDCAWRKVTCKPEGETKEEYAKRWAEQFLSMVRDWADDYIDYQIESTKCKAYDKGKADAEKPAEWSEFDKGALGDAICATDILGNDESFNKDNPNLAKAFRAAKDWLKALPERFNLEPKQEWNDEEKERIRQNGRLDVCYNPEKYGLCNKTKWSEKDEKMLEVLISNYKFLSKKYRDEEKDFFCSLNIVRDDLDMNEWLEKRLKFLCSQSHCNVVEWSDEDECILKRLIRDYEEAIRSGNGNAWEKDFQENLVWLKFLPERFNLQPKEKFSQKDKEFIDDAIACVTMCYEEYCDNKDFNQSLHHNTIDIKQWLLNIRKRIPPCWKPSKEQMNALAWYSGNCNILPVGDEVIKSLYNDLKKLL